MQHCTDQYDGLQALGGSCRSSDLPNLLSQDHVWRRRGCDTVEVTMIDSKSLNVKSRTKTLPPPLQVGLAAAVAQAVLPLFSHIWPDTSSELSGAIAYC